MGVEDTEERIPEQKDRIRPWTVRAAIAWRCSARLFWMAMGAMLAMANSYPNPQAGGVALVLFAGWLGFLLWGLYYLYRNAKEKLEERQRSESGR